MQTIARRRVIELSWRLQESKKRFQWAIPPILRSREQLSISISRYSTNQNADFVSLPRAFHEAENNFLSQSPDTPRIKKRIPFRYLGHSTKPKTTLCLNLRILRESKCRFRFVTSGTPRSQKQPSVSISRNPVNQKTDSVSLPRTFYETENNSLSQSQDTPRIKKTDFVSLPRASHEAKNNFLSQSPDTPRIKKQIPFC